MGCFQPGSATSPPCRRIGRQLILRGRRSPAARGCNGPKLGAGSGPRSSAYPVAPAGAWRGAPAIWAAATLLGLKPVMDLALTGDDLPALAQELGSDVPFLSGWRHPALLRGGASDWKPSALRPAQLRCAQLGPCFNWRCAADQGTPPPRAERLNPLGLWPLPRMPATFYLERELDFEEQAARACARGPLRPPWPGSDHCRPWQTNSAVGVVWSRSRPACARGLALLRQAGLARWGWRLSGSAGPVSLPCLRIQRRAEAAGPSWPEHSRPRAFGKLVFAAAGSHGSPP